MMHYTPKCWMVLWIASVVLGGCQPQIDAIIMDDPYPDPDTPLEFTINAKGQVQIHGKWRDVFGDYSLIREYIQKRGEAYRTVYQQREIALPVLQQGRRSQEYIPVPVKIEVEPNTKSGVVGSLKRLCREVGFIQFELHVQGSEAPLADMP